MKVCIPIQEDKGLESLPYNHFGSAPHFFIYDLEKDESRIIDNDDKHHAHGMCHPLKAIGKEKVDAILVRGIGAGALTKLNNARIESYKAEDGTVMDNLRKLKENKLRKYSVEDICNSHNCGQ